VGEQLLLFQVGSRVFAADVRDVVRIAGRGDDGPETSRLPESRLGRPFSGERGLVLRDGDAGEATLAVDGVLGVRAPAREDLRPLPALASACLTSGAVRGLVMLEDAPTPVIDLPTLLREERRGAAAPEPGDVHHA
jgi:chemotaxis signal transduction protein